MIRDGVTVIPKSAIVPEGTDDLNDAHKIRKDHMPQSSAGTNDARIAPAIGRRALCIRTKRSEESALGLDKTPKVGIIDFGLGGL